MSFVVSLEGFTPGPRFDGLPFTQARIEESTAQTGPWSTLETKALSPLDPDPSDPQQRDFTVASALTSGWYRVVWIDAAADEQVSAAIFSDQSAYQANGVPFIDLVTRLRGMTAVSLAEAKARINQAHKRMVVEGEALKSRITIGDTVLAEAVYELDPDIVQLLNLKVDGAPYKRKSVDELDDLTANEAYIVGRGRRFFAPEFSPSGAGELRIYPTPTTAGLAITGRAVMRPPDLVNNADYPSLPAEYHEDLVDGAMATVLMRDDERVQDALVIEERFRGRIKELRGSLKRRVGSGTARIKVVG